MAEGGEPADKKKRSARRANRGPGDIAGQPAPQGKRAPRDTGWPIDDEDALTRALDALEALDPARIAPLRARAGRPPLRRRAGGLDGLAAIVVSQQVSVASARAIHGRLCARFPALDAESIARADDEALRGCGLSAPKMRTLRACAEAILSGRLDLAALEGGTAEEAHAALTVVKGIGPWTADIYLLFCLGHPDAFPAGDLALQEAARLAFGLKNRPDPRRLEKLAAPWRPWRAVAARLLWSFYAIAKSREGVDVAPPAQKPSKPAAPTARKAKRAKSDA